MEFDVGRVVGVTFVGRPGGADIGVVVGRGVLKVVFAGTSRFELTVGETLGDGLGLSFGVGDGDRLALTFVFRFKLRLLLNVMFELAL